MKHLAIGGNINKMSELKFPIVCRGCKKKINDEYELWDAEKKLCDKCSMKNNTENINKPIRTYLN